MSALVRLARIDDDRLQHLFRATMEEADQPKSKPIKRGIDL